MRILHLFSARPFSPYSRLGCDPNACKIGSSAGIAFACEVGTAGLGLAAGALCVATGWFTLGLGCVAAVVGTGVVAAGCAAGTSAAEKGRLIVSFICAYS